MVKFSTLKKLLLLVAIGTIPWIMAAQTTVYPKNSTNSLVVRINGNLKAEYEALKADTSVKNGPYQYFYKDKLIEKGQYLKNQRTKLWQYYNLKGIFEYEYDYDNNKITRLSGDRDPKQATPCLFKGSPLIPYLYIVEKVGYPKAAIDKNLKGQVVLVLKIGSDGQVWAMYLSEKLHPLLDSEVMRVARSFPPDWEWLPATHLGLPIDDEYLITIEFELDE